MRTAIVFAALAAWPLLALAQTTETVTAPASDLGAPVTQPVAPSAPPAEAEAQTPPVELTPEQIEAQRQAQLFYESLHRQTGVVSIADGKITLNVPETHYFVGAEDARRILVDLWGNPPNSAQNVEGMIFLASANPAWDAWGAIVQYVPEGHVEDNDARTINYTNLLHDMQRDTETENDWRRENQYPTVTLVGWAEQPHYDAGSHKLYWAKELAFSGESLHTLNYDIRVLGREGHLVISFIATMADLDAIRSHTPAVLEMAEFTQGNTYADYRQGDHRAEYGIAGLIAGGALVAAAQKGGLLAILLALGKKFIVLVIAGFTAIGGAISRMFGRKPPQSEDPPSAPPSDPPPPST